MKDKHEIDAPSYHPHYHDGEPEEPTTGKSVNRGRDHHNMQSVGGLIYGTNVRQVEQDQEAAHAKAHPVLVKHGHLPSPHKIKAAQRERPPVDGHSPAHHAAPYALSPTAALPAGEEAVADGPTQPRFTRLGVDTNADGQENTFDPSENVQVNMGEGAEDPPAPEEEPREPSEPRFTRLGVDTTADGEENTFDPSENAQVHLGEGSDEPPPAPEEAPEPTEPRFTRKGVDTNADGQANTYVHSPYPTSHLEQVLLAC